VLDRLRLDPLTGYLFWTYAARRNQRAGTVNADGYRVLQVRRREVLAHRAVWFLYYGHWPRTQLDHINGDRDDNRPVNLREATAVQQMQNRAMPKSNTSGVHGVTWNRVAGKWQASIKVSGKNHHLGVFHNIEDAATARRNAELRFGFHPNHGRLKA
jgi:hypothetical protein